MKTIDTATGRRAAMRRVAAAVLCIGSLAGCIEKPLQKAAGSAVPGSGLGGALTCAAPGAAAAQMTILIDRTTILPKDAMNNLVGALTQVAGKHASVAITVAKTGGINASLLTTTFTRTMRAESATDYFRLSPADRALIARCYKNDQSEFAAALTATLADVDDAPKGLSPLFSSIGALSTELREHAAKRSTTFYFVSDGVEHTVGHSFYSGSGDDRLRTLSKEEVQEYLARAQLLPDLTGVKVWHLAFALPSATQTPVRLRPNAEAAALRGVWDAYWKASGATVRYGEPLPTGSLI